MLRECYSCRINKPIEAFEKNNKTKDGRRHTCKECRNTSKRNHYKKANIKWAKYRQAALSRDLTFDLSLEDFINIYWQKPCTYCGDSIVTVGIDRIDSSIGYSIDNCTPCCEICNRMKLDHSKDFWLNHMKKIINKMEK